MVLSCRSRRARRLRRWSGARESRMRIRCERDGGLGTRWGGGVRRSGGAVEVEVGGWRRW
ncbi:hypothetical protein Hanom_Chr10g00930811 [Helianthus anomalus]